MGWIAGPIALIVFSLVTLFTSYLLADCYRAADGTRNYIYKDAVKNYLGKKNPLAWFYILICPNNNQLMQEESNISFAE